MTEISGGGNENCASGTGNVRQAWIWSEYKGVLPQVESSGSLSSGAPAPSELVRREDEAEFLGGANESRPGAAAPPPRPEPKPPLKREPQYTRAPALGLAAVIVAIVGLAWLFTTRPASDPRPESATPEATLPAPGAETSKPEGAAQAPQATDVPPPPPPAPASDLESRLRAFLEQGTGKEAVFDLDGTSFDPGKPTLTAAAREQLERLAKVLSAFPKARIVISVHSDSAGSRSRNAKLSAERAKNIRGELVRLRVGRSLVTSREEAKTPQPAPGQPPSRDGQVWIGVRK